MASNLPGLENILDNLDVGIIIFDNKGTYLFVNKTLLQYTGRTRQDYLNTRYMTSSQADSTRRAS